MVRFRIDGYYPQATYSTTRAIAISDSTVLLELDAESVGRLPAQLEVLPGAVRLKV